MWNSVEDNVGHAEHKIPDGHHTRVQGARWLVIIPVFIVLLGAFAIADGSAEVGHAFGKGCVA